MNSWPRDIRNFFHKPEIGVIDTFNFILFSFRNNVFLCLHLNSFSIKCRRNPVKILKRIPQSGSLVHLVCVWSPVWTDIAVSFFAILTSWSTVCRGSVFLHYCDEIQSSMHQIFAQMYSTVSIGLSYMKSPTGFAQAPSPQTVFFHILLQNLSFYFLPIFSSLKPSKAPSKR